MLEWINNVHCRTELFVIIHFVLHTSGGVAALVALLTLDCEDIPAVALAVLCNISMHDEVRRSLTVADAGPILVRLLTSPVDDIQSRSAIVIADLACVDGNQSSLAEQGAISALVELLDSEVEDVLVNAVNAVRVMCSASPQNQISFANHGVIEPLVEFLSLDTGNSRQTRGADPMLF